MAAAVRRPGRPRRGGGRLRPPGAPRPGRSSQAALGYLEGQIVTDAASGARQYVLDAAAFCYGDEMMPSDGVLLDGLDAVAVEIADMEYAAFCHRMHDGVRMLVSSGRIPGSACSCPRTRSNGTWVRPWSG